LKKKIQKRNLGKIFFGSYDFSQSGTRNGKIGQSGKGTQHLCTIQKYFPQEYKDFSGTNESFEVNKNTSEIFMRKNLALK